MKKVVAVMVIALMAIVALAPVTTSDTTLPGVQYGIYDLNGKDSAILLLDIMYDDVTIHNFGLFVSEQAKTDFLDAIKGVKQAIIDDKGIETIIVSTRWLEWHINNDFTQIFPTITDEEVQGWNNMPDYKNYLLRIDDLKTFINNPDQIFHSEVQPCFIFCVICPHTCFAYM